MTHDNRYDLFTFEVICDVFKHIHWNLDIFKRRQQKGWSARSFWVMHPPKSSGHAADLSISIVKHAWVHLRGTIFKTGVDRVVYTNSTFGLLYVIFSEPNGILPWYFECAEITRSIEESYYQTHKKAKTVDCYKIWISGGSRNWNEGYQIAGDKGWYLTYSDSFVSDDRPIKELDEQIIDVPYWYWKETQLARYLQYYH